MKPNPCEVSVPQWLAKLILENLEAVGEERISIGKWDSRIANARINARALRPLIEAEEREFQAYVREVANAEV